MPPSLMWLSTRHDKEEEDDTYFTRQGDIFFIMIFLVANLCQLAIPSLWEITIWLIKPTNGVNHVAKILNNLGQNPRLIAH